MSLILRGCSRFRTICRRNAARLRERHGLDIYGVYLEVLTRLAYCTSTSLARRQRRFASLLPDCDGHCVEAIDSVGEEHPSDRGAEKAEDDSSGCARTLVEVFVGSVFGFGSG